MLSKFKAPWPQPIFKANYLHSMFPATGHDKDGCLARLFVSKHKLQSKFANYGTVIL
jgi:hypothetical protein